MKAQLHSGSVNDNDDDDAYGDGADEDDEDVLILNGLSPPLPLCLCQ